MALRWIGALVEPPIAELTRIALMKAAAGHDVGGLEVLVHHSTMRLPVRQAISCRSR